MKRLLILAGLVLGVTGCAGARAASTGTLPPVAAPAVTSTVPADVVLSMTWLTLTDDIKHNICALWGSDPAGTLARIRGILPAHPPTADELGSFLANACPRVPAADDGLVGLRSLWSALSIDGRQLLCDRYRTAPDEVHGALVSAAGQVTPVQLAEFMTDEC